MSVVASARSCLLGAQNMALKKGEWGSLRAAGTKQMERNPDPQRCYAPHPNDVRRSSPGGCRLQTCTYIPHQGKG